MFKVIRSNIQIAITPQQIARFHSNLVQSLTMAQPVYYKCSRSMVKGQGHSITLTHQQQKCYKMVTDRLSDFKLGMGIVIKSDRDWRDVGWP